MSGGSSGWQNVLSMVLPTVPILAIFGNALVMIAVWKERQASFICNPQGNQKRRSLDALIICHVCDNWWPGAHCLGRSRIWISARVIYYLSICNIIICSRKYSDYLRILRIFVFILIRYIRLLRGLRRESVNFARSSISNVCSVKPAPFMHDRACYCCDRFAFALRSAHFSSTLAIALFISPALSPSLIDERAGGMERAPARTRKCFLAMIPAVICVKKRRSEA